jgi:hypothetical protein
MKRRTHQQGIALITTLIMLSVVTLMAVAFLAVSRRERAVVATATDRATAKAMAEAALQRAEAEVVARALSTSNMLAADLLVSTTYNNPDGFVPGNTNVANVSYHYASGAPLTGNDLLAMYRNLQIDPRAPVFVVTNEVTGEQEFRYYLDYNRNGLIETNGVQVEIDDFGRSLGITNFHIGDPEWIGVLRRPDQPHSGSNLFIGRYLYMVLPVGKSLDLNYIHNQSKRPVPFTADGYMRNQGLGSWELNLAAFLRDLNTNAWNGYFYNTNFGAQSTGIAFNNALTILRYRYRLSPTDLAPSYFNLTSYFGMYGLGPANISRADGIDIYGNGPIQWETERPYTGATPPYTILDNDEPTDPWSGADNPSQYFDLQELFSIREPTVLDVDQFTNRLVSISTNLSTYNRHTFYRLLAQLGTDSVPANRGRIHLNYDNRLDFDETLIANNVQPGILPTSPNVRPGFYYHATNFVRWTPGAFITNAADKILKALHPPGDGVAIPQIAITNIPVWPTNYYSPAVHRAIQVAANIFDATTNRPSAAPHVPTVMRPVFQDTGAEVRIVGFEDVTDNWLSVWNVDYRDIDEGGVARPTVSPYNMVYGVPAIIGAKKGYPNFNEFELQTVVVAGRKLEIGKRSPSASPSFTNQLYTLSISNVLGVEFWNSYETDFPRELELRVVVDTRIFLSNETRVVRWYTNSFSVATNIPAGSWTGRRFEIPIYTNITFLPQSAYRLADGSFTFIGTNTAALNLFEPAQGFPIPVWRLSVTNRLRAALVDKGAVPGEDRLVDYVNLDNLNSYIDITSELFGQRNDAGLTSLTGSFWVTNRTDGVPDGIHNQIQASLGAINVANWNSVSSEPMQGLDREKSIQRFRQFMGYEGVPSPPSPTLRMQAPFSPGIKLLHTATWQVNDPLVNDYYWDLVDPTRTNNIERLPPLFDDSRERSNLGKVNQRYRPWGESGGSSSPTARAEAINVALKDPQIRKSDDWNFPTNMFPTIGWLGKVHRGTPWQTMYMKSAETNPQEWQLWSGHPEWRWPNNVIPRSAEPTTDWLIFDLFTTAVNDNAARGLLGVNQEGLAAWSAVLSGVPVLTNDVVSTNVVAGIIEPNTPELRTIVNGINAARLTRPFQKFRYMGEVLSTPELSIASPYFRVAIDPDGFPADAVVERIPQMILSLLKPDDPRFVVLAYGQSLAPAPASRVTDLGPFFQMPTNYIITGEYVTKTFMRLERTVERDPGTGDPVIRVRAVKENYNEVPPTE